MSNYAFIDSQNVNLSIKDQGWKLDWFRFRVYLKDKYNVSKAYLFIGYLSGNERLYAFLQEAGFICIFRPTMELPDGTVKGNVDTELVLHTMLQLENFDEAIIVSGDGDFFCLIQHLLSVDKLRRMLVPNQKQYSGLLKQLSRPDRNIFDFINPLRGKLEYRKK